jgi:outer membrane protein
MTRTPTPCRLLIAMLLTSILAGCVSVKLDDHPLLSPALDQVLHEVESFDPATAGKTLEPLQETGEKAQLERVMSEPPVKKAFRFSLAEVRQSTLQNNLDLAAAFYNPAISGTQVVVERAKFEATFNLTAQRTKTVGPEYTPFTGTLTDTALLQTSIQPTLNVPLITGGAISLGPLFASSDYQSPDSGGEQYWQSSAQISLTQPLLRNAGIAYNEGSIALAMYQQRMDTARTKLSVINTLLSAEVTYWNVYLAWRVLEIQREQYNLYQKELRDAQKLERSGVRTMADVYGFEAGLALQVGQVVQANNNLRQAIRELKVLMHDPSLSLDYTIGVEPTTKPSLVHYQFDADSMLRAALQNRMDLLESELQLAADALNIRLAKNQTLPQLDLTLSNTWNGFSFTGYGNATNRLLHDDDVPGWNMGVTASVPLGNKAATAQLRSAVLRRLQDIATRNQREVTIVKDVYSALDALDTAWLGLLAARYRVRATESNFTAEKKLFSLGNRTSTDVSDALLGLGSARVAEAQAEAAYQVSMAQLAAATGTLLGYSKVEWSTGAEQTVVPSAFGGKR